MEDLGIVVKEEEVYPGTKQEEGFELVEEAVKVRNRFCLSTMAEGEVATLVDRTRARKADKEVYRRKKSVSNKDRATFSRRETHRSSYLEEANGGGGPLLNRLSRSSLS